MDPFNAIRKRTSTHYLESPDHIGKNNKEKSGKYTHTNPIITF